MNSRYFSHSAKLVIVAVILFAGTYFSVSASAKTEVIVVADKNGFSDSAEAGKLRRAYHILATGDHDYKGNRVKAMRSVEAAGKLLGMNLSGDDKDHEKQALSDDKLREASGLLSNVLNAAEVKNQKRITKHINEAIKHIRTALAIK